MNILFCGHYDPLYNRTAIISKGLVELGHQVKHLVVKKKNRLIRNEIARAAADADFIFLPSFTHKDVGFVKKAAPQKIIIFDPLVSRYMTKVEDYKTLWKWGFGALRSFYQDKWSLETADFVVTDTLCHLEYFHKRYGIQRYKMAPLYIGNDFNAFSPASSNFELDHARPQLNAPSKGNPFRVGFYGALNPLQGVLRILEAAHRLRDEKDIRFEIIGTGFEYEKALQFIKEKDLKNVETPGWLAPQELAQRLNTFDLALGIFGTTSKADLVIPNKIYHYAGCALPILTKDSPAIRELFADGKTIALTTPEPAKIADEILRLKNSPELLRNLGARAHAFVLENLNQKKVASQLIEIFKSISSQPRINPNSASAKT